jgi:hypothetical protein
MARGRPPNSAETVTLTVSTTRLMKVLLDVVAEDGTYGKNAAEAANLLIAEKLRDLRAGEGILAERLARAQRRFHADHPRSEA